MEKVVQHAQIRRRALRRGPVIAGLALAVPLGTAGAAAAQTVPLHPVAVAVPGAPAVPSHDGAPPGAQCNGSLFTATLMPFSEHMNHAHFGRSPQQQASDIQDADTYTKTHTVLVENMSQPGRDDLFAISDGSTSPFVEHMYHAHFERSPMQQADDLSQVDSYAKLHMVLVEHMLQPSLAAVSGDC